MPLKWLLVMVLLWIVGLDPPIMTTPFPAPQPSIVDPLKVPPLDPRNRTPFHELAPPEIVTLEMVGVDW